MIAIGICIISLLLLAIIWLLTKIITIGKNIHESNFMLATRIKNEIGKVWVLGENITHSIDAMTNSIDTYRKDFKLTFDDKFAKRVEEIVGLNLPINKTMQIIGMDGKAHTVPIDEGY